MSDRRESRVTSAFALYANRRVWPVGTGCTNLTDWLDFAFVKKVYKRTGLG
jgi:hypothetical protein